MLWRWMDIRPRGWACCRFTPSPRSRRAGPARTLPRAYLSTPRGRAYPSRSPRSAASVCPARLCGRRGARPRAARARPSGSAPALAPSPPEHPPPPRAPCGRLGAWRIGPGGPFRRLRGHLWGFCGLFWSFARRGELAHGDGLLRDYLLLAPHLVPQKLHLALQAGYERAVVGVYPFVLPAVYPASSPGVQVDEHPPVWGLVVPERLTSDPFADGALGDAQPAGGLLDRHPVQPGVYPPSITFGHARILAP